MQLTETYLGRRNFLKSKLAPNAQLARSTRATPSRHDFSQTLLIPEMQNREAATESRPATGSAQLQRILNAQDHAEKAAGPHG